MSDLYGPATDAVLEYLTSYRSDVDGVREALKPWSWPRGRIEAEYKMLKLPRDFAWHRFHDGLTAHGLRAEFDQLWGDLNACRTGQLLWSDCCAQDAICAQLLAPYVDQGPFTRSDFDVLMAPWRAGVEDDARARLFFAVAAYPPFDRDFWPTVDAGLAQSDSPEGWQRRAAKLHNQDDAT